MIENATALPSTEPTGPRCQMPTGYHPSNWCGEPATHWQAHGWDGGKRYLCSTCAGLIAHAIVRQPNQPIPLEAA